jgi:hypothetical protein
MRARVITTLAGLSIGGCYQGLSGDPAGGGEDSAASGWDEPAGSEGGSDDGADDGPPASQCGDTIEIGTTPLRRLTRAQYDATVRDLLGDASAPAQSFVDDERHGGFDSNTSVVAGLQVDQYRQAAVALAEAAAATSFDTWMPCDRATDECVAPFIDSFGQRAYRRPLTALEHDELLEMYREGRDEWGADSAVELVVQSLLMSPHFLYHIELGAPDAAGPVRALTGYEIASRLSYSLWGTMPDDELFAAAADGTLDDPEGIEAQARRMLQDPRTEQMLLDFGNQWLELDSIEAASRNAEDHDGWSEELRLAIRRETETFLRETILNGDGKLETLFSASWSYVDDDLAAIYGVTPSADPLGRVELPPEERAGLLTQASFFLKLGPTRQGTDRIHTGKFVRTRLLCGEMPPPPPDVELDPGVDRMERAECVGCHQLMDPIGQAFETYDSLGAHTTVDADGNTIPAGGEVVGSEIGTFDSVVELARELSTSEEARACMARSWGWYVLARDLAEPEDECSTEHIAEAFASSDHDIRELVIGIVRSDAFRHIHADA